MTRQKKRNLVLLVALAGLAVAGITLYTLRQELWVEWYRWHAASECESFFDQQSGPPPSFDGSPTWRRVLEMGEAGYPVLAALLADRDERVWRPARVAIEQILVGRSPYRAALEGLPSYLCEAAPLSYLRLFLAWGYVDCGDWQAIVECNRDDRFEGVGPDARLVATPAALAHVDDVVRQAAIGNDDGSDDFARLAEFRAVDALAAMRLPEGNRVGPAAECRLADIARQGRSAELRLHALNALACAGRVPAGGATWDLPELWHWELFSRLGPKYSRLVKGSVLRFEHPLALPALLSLDDPRALRVLARLESLPGFASRLEAARAVPGVELSARKRWQPLTERAAAYLEGTPGERALAALALADLGDPDGAPILRRALRREENQETRLLLQSSLVALGDATCLDVVEAELASRAAKRKAGGVVVFPPPDRWARLSTHGDDRAEIGFSDLVLHLLRSGSRESLDQVLEDFLTHADFLHVALELTEVIDDFEVDWNTWNRGRWKSRSEFLRVRNWFLSHRDDLVWDAGVRRYRLRTSTR